MIPAEKWKIPGININSIMEKVKTFSESSEGKRQMKERIQEYKKSGKSGTAAGGVLATDKDMQAAAQELIQLLQNEARNADLPPSVMMHFSALNCSTPQKMPDGSSIVYVRFGGDLYRDSLEDGDGGYTGEGIDNIIALFNNGYHASRSVYGIWRSHSTPTEDLWIPSKKDREGLFFVQKAIDAFNNSYGATHHVTAVAGNDYQ